MASRGLTSLAEHLYMKLSPEEYARISQATPSNYKRFTQLRLPLPLWQAQTKKGQCLKNKHRKQA